MLELLRSPFPILDLPPLRRCEPAAALGGQRHARVAEAILVPQLTGDGFAFLIQPFAIVGVVADAN
jgi:hypothetical protein